MNTNAFGVTVCNYVTFVFVCLIAVPLLSLSIARCIHPQAVDTPKEEVLPTNDFLVPGLHIRLIPIEYGPLP